MCKVGRIRLICILSNIYLILILQNSSHTYITYIRFFENFVKCKMKQPHIKLQASWLKGATKMSEILFRQ